MSGRLPNFRAIGSWDFCLISNTIKLICSLVRWWCSKCQNAFEKIRQQCLFQEIMTNLFKIIHKPCWEHSHILELYPCTEMKHMSTHISYVSARWCDKKSYCMKPLPKNFLGNLQRDINVEFSKFLALQTNCHLVPVYLRESKHICSTNIL